MEQKTVQTKKEQALTPNYGVEVFTGIRPTGSLTVANYVGAVRPTLSLVEAGMEPLVFVADLHGLTTHEPRELVEYTREVIVDYLALGLDPNKANIFVQSAISSQVLELTCILSRHISIGELLRVPTLKDKVGKDKSETTASAFLALYPVMMGADILLQRANRVPVGQDQVSHLELTRHLAARFNKQYGNVFPDCHALILEEGAKILGLKGETKMGKSYPNEALFLTDTPDVVKKKVSQAVTAFDGEMSEALKSHVTLAKALTSDTTVRDSIDDIIARHLAGEKVMGQFKTVLTDVSNDFLSKFQAKRNELLAEPSYVDGIVAKGNAIAHSIGSETIRLVKEAMGM